MNSKVNNQALKNIILPKEFKAPHLLSGLEPSAPILVGLSGGADSSALLLMLKGYSEQSGAKIYAAHLNHGIRGEEADRDERFCKELAESLGITFFSIKLDIPAMAKQSGESIECEARNARYDFFNRLMRENSISILATAHNADDNLETVIFNLSRGSGLLGLCGIPSSRPTECGIVIRPILDMEKKDIIAFCNENNINYVTDSTNADNDYSRNKIRNQIIPILKEINSAVIKNTSRASDSLKEDAAYLKTVTDKFISESCEDRTIELSVVRNTPPSIINRALISIYSDISDGETLEATHIGAIKNLAQRGVPHSSISLPSSIEAVIEDGRLCFIRKKEEKKIENFNLTLNSGFNAIESADIDIFINIEPYSKNIYKKSILLSIDSAKINGALIARSRRAGDKILSGKVHKSLKKLFNEKKVPIELRERIPVICDGDGILAIPSVAIRDGARLTQKNAKETKITVCIR